MRLSHTDRSVQSLTLNSAEHKRAVRIVEGGAEQQAARIKSIIVRSDWFTELGSFEHLFTSDNFAITSSPGILYYPNVLKSHV